MGRRCAAERQHAGPRREVARRKWRLCVVRRKWLLCDTQKRLLERLRLVKTAWIAGGGPPSQRWLGLERVGKTEVLADLRAAFAKFPEHAVPLPAGLYEAAMSEDFDFSVCLARLGLNWVKVRWNQGRGGKRRREEAGREEEDDSFAATERSGPRTRLPRKTKPRLAGRLRARSDTPFGDGDRWLLCDTHEGLRKRMKLVKAAWYMAGGPGRQGWFRDTVSKAAIRDNIREGLAQFTECAVPIPSGLREAALSGDFDIVSCLAQFGLDWGEAKKCVRGKHEVAGPRPGPAANESQERAEQEAAGGEHAEPAGAGQQEQAEQDGDGPLLGDPKKRLLERLKVVKAAWLAGGGPGGQGWFHQLVSKAALRDSIREGLAKFSEYAVPLPAGLREATMSEDFDFVSCQARFGLDWATFSRWQQEANRRLYDAGRHPRPAATMEEAHRAEPKKVGQAEPKKVGQAEPKKVERESTEREGEGDSGVVSERFGPRPLVRLAEDRCYCPRTLFPREATVLLLRPPPGPPAPRLCEPTLAEASAQGLHCADPPPFLGAVPPELGLAGGAALPPWRLLLIVGPSGSGKSSLLRSARTLLAPAAADEPLYPVAAWKPGVAIIDQIPGSLEEAKSWLCGVGLSSVPSWCKPYSALSRGEAYRANVARALAGAKAGVPLVFDEWTSELDRGVARCVSAALRRRLSARRDAGHEDPPLLLATCHEDVRAHLVPDIVVRCQAGAPPVVEHTAAAAAPGLNAPPARAAIRGAAEVLPPGGTMVGLWRCQGESPQDWIILIRPRRMGDKTVLFMRPHGVAGVCSDLCLGESGPAADTKANEADASQRGVWLYGRFPNIGMRIRFCLAASGDELLVQMRTDTWEGDSLEAVIADRRKLRQGPLAKLLGETIPAETYCKALFKVSQLVKLSPEDRLALKTKPRLRCQEERTRIEEVVSAFDADLRLKEAKLADLLKEALRWCPAVSATRMPMLTTSCTGYMVAREEGDGYGGARGRRRLREVGWHLPPQPEDLFPGLCLAASRSFAPAFHLDPRRESREPGLVHLASYVGEQGGWLSPALGEVGRLLDGGFDGLCVHALPGVGGGLPGDFALAVLRGPSGSGKTALATELFGPPLEVLWDEGAPALAHFPSLALARSSLSAVDLDLETAMRPAGLLSGGERERATLARGLAEWAAGERSTLVVDEFSSLLDRAAAKRMAGGITNFVRARPALRGLVLLCCHDDVVGRGLLEPGWVFDCGDSSLHTLAPAPAVPPASPDSGGRSKEVEVAGRRILQKRPARPLELAVRRALPCEWRRFREHHYKDHRLKGDSICFVGELGGRAVAFLAATSTGFSLLYFLGRNQVKATMDEMEKLGLPAEWSSRTLLREHRTVVFPDSQGLGLGSLMADAVAHLCERMGYTFLSTTAHPTYGGYRDRSPLWATLSTSLRARPAGNCPTFSHLWRGCMQGDGSTDPERERWLRSRVAVEGSLTTSMLEVEPRGAHGAAMQRRVRRGGVLEQRAPAAAPATPPQSCT